MGKRQGVSRGGLGSRLSYVNPNPVSCMFRCRSVAFLPWGEGDGFHPAVALSCLVVIREYQLEMKGKALNRYTAARASGVG